MKFQMYNRVLANLNLKFPMRPLRNKKFKILSIDQTLLLKRVVKLQTVSTQVLFTMLRDFAEIVTTARVEINLQLNVNT